MQASVLHGVCMIYGRRELRIKLHSTMHRWLGGWRSHTGSSTNSRNQSTTNSISHRCHQKWERLRSHSSTVETVGKLPACKYHSILINLISFSVAIIFSWHQFVMWYLHLLIFLNLFPRVHTVRCLQSISDQILKKIVCLLTDIWLTLLLTSCSMFFL